MSHHHYKPVGPMKPMKSKDYLILVIIFIIIGAVLSLVIASGSGEHPKTHHRAR